MGRKEFEALIFDVDGTLIPETSSWFAMTEGLGASVESHSEIYSKFLARQISYEAAKSQLLTLWQSTGRANREFIGSFFERLPTHPEAKRVIEFLKSKGYLICLISSAVDLHVQKVAEKLEIDHYFSSAGLIWDAEGNLVDFYSSPNQGERKLEQFLEFCQAHGVDPKKCAVIGDDINDLELFIFTNRGVAVSSASQKLAEKSWKRVESLGELEELF